MARKSSRPSRSLAEITARFGEHETIPERVAASLRESILTGQLRPGDPIVESKLARELGVGQPTVREALKTLENEGLLTRQLNRGCSVTKLSPAEMEMIFRLRIELEPLAVQLARERWNDEKTARLKAAFAALTAAAQTGDLRVYFLADLDFHRTLWALSDNPFLERALTQVVVPQFAFSILVLFNRTSFSVAENVEGHRLILEAVLHAPPEEAVRITRQAIVDFRKIDRETIY